jgi:hypothetical protein
MDGWMGTSLKAAAVVQLLLAALAREESLCKGSIRLGKKR